MRNRLYIHGNTITPMKTHIDYFKQYKPETERAIRKFEVTKDKTLESLKEAFRELKSPSDSKGMYKQAIRLVENLSYSSKDITNFSIALIEFQEEEVFGDRAGLFLSALINTCKDEEFTIITEHLEEPINFLGYKNIKHITVKGNAGNLVGSRMKGGILTVKGDVGNWVGWGMEGGTITVKGNAEDWVGYGMKGGTIHIEGDFRSLSRFIYGGNIYHKGKLIVKNVLRHFCANRKI